MAKSQRRHYSDEARAAALAVLDANGGNLTRAAKDAGVPMSTLKHWRDDRDRAAPSEVRAALRDDLALMMGLAAGSLREVAHGKPARLRNRPGGGTRKGHAVVYIMRCDGFVKIGMTMNLATRLSAMRVCCPHEIEVDSVGPHLPRGAAVELEERMHAEFWRDHHRGEWFALSGSDLARARAMLEVAHVEAPA